MPLTFDVASINNYDEKYTFGKVDEDHPNGDTWHPVTQAIVFTCMGIGMGEITEKNWKEFYRRTHIWERTCGAMLIRGENDNDKYLTPQEIKDHIGLKTNVFPMISKASFSAKVMKYFDYGVDKKIREVENA